MDFLIVVLLLAAVFLTPIYLLARVGSRAVKRRAERSTQTESGEAG